MQPSTSTTVTTTFSTYRRCTDAPGHNRNSPHGPAPTRVSARPNVFQLPAKPVQPASSKDFHLDTFFNPVWMSGPHVFSFAKDGTVVSPETYPGCRASAASSSGRNVHGAALPSPSPSPSFPPTPISKALRTMDKAWKNIAMTEQDDAEFVAMEAEVEMRAQAEAKGKLMGLVYTWPPKSQPAACAECEVLAVPRRRVEAGPRSSVGVGTPESAVPTLSYGSSGESEMESEVFRVVPGRRDMAHRNEVPMEKNIGFERLRRKAPAPLVFTGMEEGEGESGWTLFGTPWTVGQYGGEGLLSPLTAMSWAEDQLTVNLKAILRMPED